MFEKLKSLFKKEGAPEKKEARPFEKKPDMPKEKRVQEVCSSQEKDSAEKKAPALEKGKHGLKRIEKEEDLEALFEAEGEHSQPPPPVPPKMAPLAKANPSVKKKGKKRSKNGILILDGKGDILSQMAEEALREEDRVAGRPSQKELAPLPALKKVQKDKNGLPILGEGEVPTSKESGDFAALLAAYLSEKSEAVLLNEKRDRMEPARKITLAERLKFYPPVQAELDLHGYTAAKADQTAELYIRRAFSSGTYTLRIIVGKGLHSEHGAVLPDVIADRLIALKQGGIVLDWKWEKGKKSKSGAMVVYLNNYDSSKFQR